MQQREGGSPVIGLFPLKGVGTLPLIPNRSWNRLGRIKGQEAPDLSAGKREWLWQERIAYRLLILFLALLYFTPGTLYTALEDLPIAKGVVFLSFFFLFLAKRTDRTSWHLTDKTTLWFLAFMLVGALSVLDALWREYALSTFLNALKLLVAYLLIVNLVDHSRKVRQIFWTLILSAMVPALGTLYHYVFKVDLIGGYRAAWIGVYSDPNDLAYNLVVLIPIGLALLESEEKWLFKGILLSQLAVLTAAIYVTFSRGALVSLFVVLFFQVIRSNNRMFYSSIGSVLLLVLLMVAPTSFWSRAETIVNFKEDASAMGRFYAWRAGFSMLQDRPLLGVGIGCFVMGWPIYAPPEAGTLWRAPHNTFIQVMGETGILGSITFLVFLGTAIRGLQKLKFGRVSDAPHILSRKPVQSRTGSDPKGRIEPRPPILQRMWNRPRLKKEVADYYVRGLEIALWGFLACSLTLGIARSWPPYIFIGLAVALRQIRMVQNGKDAPA
jgi:O-antigen ligase